MRTGYGLEAIELCCSGSFKPDRLSWRLLLYEKSDRDDVVWMPLVTNASPLGSFHVTFHGIYYGLGQDE